MERSGMTAAALAALLLSGTAHAEGKPSFDEADADGNGKVSIQEAKKAGIPEAEAKKEDVDSDGNLTERDWAYVKKDPKPSQGEGKGPAGPPQGGPESGPPKGGGQPGGGDSQPGM